MSHGVILIMSEHTVWYLFCPDNPQVMISAYEDPFSDIYVRKRLKVLITKYSVGYILVVAKLIDA